MSQPDLARTLRSARPVAPPELRERVRLVAAQASPPRRQPVTWRRALVVVVVVGAAVAAGVIATRPSHRAIQLGAVVQPAHRKAAVPFGAASSADKLGTVAPAPSATRTQRYTASLELRVPTAAAVSSATRQAIAIANSLGGYQAYVNLDASGKTGYAEIRLRIPKVHVQEAVRRLSALGRVVGEHVQIQDLQAGVDATDRLIAGLQQQLAGLRTQPQTALVQREIAALTTQIVHLQRGRSATVRTSRYATVEVSLSVPPVTPPKPHHPGPLHGLGTAFRWIGIGAVYGLAVGAPFLALSAAIWLAVRALRRRREDSLLSRS
jgi:uncharacterized protein DUF4349